jgi:hypothetical protein
MNILELQAALEIGQLPVTLKKVKGEWCAVVPSVITKNGGVEKESHVTLCSYAGSLRRLRFILATRYLAQVYEDSMCAFINLRWALKLPNWGGRFGALPELANAMKRAGLI